MKDYLVKVISESGSIRGYACITTGLVNEAYRRQNPATLAGIMLGRTLSGAALMGGTVKDQQRIALKLEGNGPLQKIVTESDATGKVRGYVAVPSHEFVENEDVGIQIRKSIGGAGILTVTKDLGLKQPYHGSVHVISGEVGEDLAYYLTESEQIPSAVSVGVIPSADGSRVDAAGGFLVQAIPAEGGNSATEAANLEAISEMVEAMPPITRLLVQGKSPEEIIAHIFSEVPYKVLETVELEYRCSCSRLAMNNAFKVLGKDDLENLIEEQGGADATCHFCGEVYNYIKGDLLNILSQMN